MKKIIFTLITLVTAVVCVNARVCGSTGCYSNSQRGGYSHDRTCRVVGTYDYCDTYDGVYFQLSPGMSIKPDMGFVGSLGIGRKYSSGMTFGIRFNGKYVNHMFGASAGLATTYEFTAMRKYTDIFYPIIGIEAGFGGVQAGETKSWDWMPYAGCKAGFRFAVVRGRFDVGVEYNGNYNFAIASLAKNSSSFFEHSVLFSLCAYLPN